MVRRLLFIVALVLCAIGFAGVTARADSVPMLLNPDAALLQQFSSNPLGAIKAARELIAEGKMDQAIKGLQLYVVAHPLEFGPRRFLGDLYFRTGQIDRAKFTYQEMLKLVPSDKETHNRLGTVYAVEGDINGAIEQFTAALPGTDSVDDLVALHARKGDLPAYRAEMEKVAANDQFDAPIQAELGQIFNALRSPYQGSVYFKHALDLDPQNLTAINGLGLSYLAMHDYAGAIAEFKTCLGVDPLAYQCENNLGAAQLDDKQYAAAKKSLDAAYKLAPERGETFSNYGYLADMQGDWQQAVTDYARAIAMWPYLREAYIDIAIDYEAHDLNALAQQALIKGIASVYDDGRLHYLLGRAYEAQGDRAKAIVQYKLAATGTDPDAARIAQAHVSELGLGSSGEKPQ